MCDSSVARIHNARKPVATRSESDSASVLNPLAKRLLAVSVSNLSWDDRLEWLQAGTDAGPAKEQANASHCDLNAQPVPPRRRIQRPDLRCVLFSSHASRTHPSIDTRSCNKLPPVDWLTMRTDPSELSWTHRGRIVDTDDCTPGVEVVWLTAGRR